MASRLRRATGDDWRRYVGTEPPALWYGLTADAGYMLLGIGGVFLGTDDRWWATFHRAPGVRDLALAQRAARVVQSVASEAGLTVHAMPDPRISTAAFWLSRLGFIETDEEIDNCKVWRWVLK
jgi:hypothetical protein